jgi:pimeloyl-ACP methyl ester carboxylesterase
VKQRWKVLIGLVAALAVLLAINTIVVNGQTKDAEITVEAQGLQPGGQILQLPGGDVQVVDTGPVRESRGTGRPIEQAPIVLIHCYACSLHWFDRLAPLLARRHRVIRIDLLGHGGSEKPKRGYGIDQQAALVAAALGQLEVQGAVVVGHSMGFSVAVGLAARASQLVDRLVNIDEGPNQDVCELPFLAKLAYAPVIGEAAWRISPDFAVEDGYSDAFAPDYDISSGFENPDQVIDDYNAMTFTAFKDAREANDDFQDELPLDDRLRQIPVPLLSVFGSEDQICDPEESQAAYEAVPGARIATVEDAGHSPNVERPEETAALIEEFAAEAIGITVRPRA